MGFTSTFDAITSALKGKKPVLDLYKAFNITTQSPAPASSGLAKYLGAVDSQEEEDEITKNYMDLGKNQEEIDANLEAEGFESNPQRESRLAAEEKQDALDNLEKRKMLRGRITEAFGRGLSEEDREEELAKLSEEGINTLGIDTAAMKREIGEEQGLFDKEAERVARKKSYDDFFARANSPNRTLGVGQKRELYSRRKKYRLAKRLRKDGFGRAAEALALEYGRSPEAMAPSISTPALRRKMQEDSNRAAEIREANRGLTQLLIAKTQKQLKDPEFNLFK